MRILYIDTSSSFLYAGITEEGKLLAECKKRFDHDLSKEALKEIIHLFELASLKPEQIDKIIVVNGPGSFTGIRIGITIAKVYAWSLKTKITTITSLEAMAISSTNEKVKVPMMDARRGYVYASAYDKDNKIIIPPQHIKLESLLEKLNEVEEYIVITNDEIEKFPNHETYSPDILKIVNFCKDRENISPHAVNPNYLKQTEAEEKKNENV